MKKDLNEYLGRIPEIGDIAKSKLIDYFTYFLTIINDAEGVRASDIRECFRLADKEPYSNISQYLSKRSKSRRGHRATFVRVKDSYRLERRRKDEIEKELRREPVRREASKTLQDLAGKIPARAEKEFLQEAMHCFEIEAYRAAIVMVWILAVDHLFAYVLKHKLTDFNAALAKNKDKRIRIRSVIKKDDLTEIPESKFIEFCRSAKIVTVDVFNILDQKLRTRNSSAHPSGVSIGMTKASDFIEDLVNNVILKYKV